MLKSRQDDERHGLWLCLASRIENRNPLEVLKLQDVLPMLEEAKTTKYRREDLVAEALSKLITASCDRLVEEDCHSLAVSAKCLIDKWMCRNEVDIIDAVAAAADRVFGRLAEFSPDEGNSVLKEWMAILDRPTGGKSFSPSGLTITYYPL